MIIEVITFKSLQLVKSVHVNPQVIITTGETFQSSDLADFNTEVPENKVNMDCFRQPKSVAQCN